MNDKLVSVIVTVYNAEKYITKALKSLFSQTMTDGVEYVIVNDCSTDCSLNVINHTVAEYPHLVDQIKIISHSFNQGSAIARQTGIDNASGEYTIHMDSDDYCEPEMLEKLYNKALDNSADIVYCDYYINFPNQQIYRSQIAITDSDEFLAGLINGKIHGSMCNKLIRRKLYVESGIRFIPGLNVWEDLLIVIKLASFAKTVSYLPSAFLHYMQVNPCSYTSYSTEASRNNIKEAVKEIEHFLQQKCLINQFKEDLAYRKLYAKSDLLRYTPHGRRKEVVDLYDDIPLKYIFQTPSIQIYYKIALYFASLHQIWIAESIYKLIDLLKVIIR